MPLGPETVGIVLSDRTFTYDVRDTILYALGIGAGSDGDSADLPFVYEAGLRCYPTQITVVAWDDSWIRRLGLDETMIVHGEQRITLHQALPPQSSVRAQARIVGMVDKGIGLGALIYVETRISAADGGKALATLLSTVFARGDGGFGGTSSGAITRHAIPDRSPDFAVDAVVALNQALLFRLSGDRNPLHADPAFAKAAGFDRPILHGLSSYGMAVRRVIR
jgi:hypothetical protein